MLAKTTPPNPKASREAKKGAAKRSALYLEKREQAETDRRHKDDQLPADAVDQRAFVRRKIDAEKLRTQQLDNRFWWGSLLFCAFLHIVMVLYVVF